MTRADPEINLRHLTGLVNYCMCQNIQEENFHGLSKINIM